MSNRMSRPALLIAQSARVRRLIESSPLTVPVVGRFIAGTTEADALAVATSLTAANCMVTLNHLGEYTTEPRQAVQDALACQSVLRLLSANGLAHRADMSLKLSSLGRSLPANGEKIALENARKVCATAAETGATVTLDMEEYSTVDSTLDILRELRADFPWVGAVLQAQLRRTEADCADLAGPGSRVRLCKGAYAAPSSVAFTAESEVDRSYVRCLKTLFGGQGYPMVATHDPRLIEIADQLAAGKVAGKPPRNYEYQMLYGFRADEQWRLAAAGKRMRVYVPYGSEWYGYFIRRLAERPANLRFFLRGLVEPVTALKDRYL